MSFRKDGLPLQHGAITLLAKSRLEQPQQEELFIAVFFLLLSFPLGIVFFRDWHWRGSLREESS